jgi:hypothetical protein
MQNFLILVWPRQALLVIGLMCPLKLWVLMGMQHLNTLLQVCKMPVLIKGFCCFVPLLKPVMIYVNLLPLCF